MFRSLIGGGKPQNNNPADAAEIRQRRGGGKTFEEFSADMKRKRARKKVAGGGDDDGGSDGDDDEKRADRIRKREKMKKEKRMEVSREGGRERPVKFGSSIYYDQDFLLMFLIIIGLDIIVPMFQLYVQLGGFGNVLSGPPKADGPSVSHSKAADRSHSRMARDIEAGKQRLGEQAKSIIRLLIVACFWVKRFTWWTLTLELLGRRIMFSTDELFSSYSAVGDMVTSTFVLCFYNSKLGHLLRFYGVFYRLYLIHLDELDIGIGEVEVHFDAIESKLEKERDKVVALEKKVSKQEKEISGKKDEIETLQQALFFAAQSAEDDTKYFFQALEEVGAIPPEALAQMKDDLGGAQSEHHGHSHGDGGHHGHSHGKAGSEQAASKDRMSAKQTILANLMEEKRMKETIKRTKNGKKIKINADGSFKA
jgi:hypothetical protein